MMEIVSVNIGKARAFDNEMGRTGIFKTAQPGRVRVLRLGVGDDDICNLRHHGGPDQAVYVYGQPDYAFWEHELGRQLAPGTFGENLTIAGLESQKLMIGDQLQIGDLVLEITSPRIPCATFAKVMGDSLWVARFHDAQRPGAYARVVTEGTVAAGDTVDYVPFAGEKVPVTDLTSDYKNPSPERMRRFLKVPIHDDMRAQYARTLTQQAQQQQQ